MIPFAPPFVCPRCKSESYDESCWCCGEPCRPHDEETFDPRPIVPPVFEPGDER